MHFFMSICETCCIENGWCEEIDRLLKERDLYWQNDIYSKKKADIESDYEEFWIDRHVICTQVDDITLCKKHFEEWLQPFPDKLEENDEEYRRFLQS